MSRRTPLTPIFDEEPRRGALTVGRQPGWEPPMVNLVGASVAVTPGTTAVTTNTPISPIGASVTVTPGTLTVT